MTQPIVSSKTLTHHRADFDPLPLPDGRDARHVRHVQLRILEPILSDFDHHDGKHILLQKYADHLDRQRAQDIEVGRQIREQGAA